MRIEEAVRREIEELHRFLASWFRGEGPGSADRFEEGIGGRLVEGFVNVQPAGRVLSRDALLAGIRQGYGANPEFRIEIRDVVVRFHDRAHGLVLTTYLELQRGAKNTEPSDNARVSTVLLEQVAGSPRFRWLHIHETATAWPPG